MNSAAVARRASSEPRAGHALAVAIIVLVTTVAFLPVLGNGFVNWDDPDVFQRNPQLGSGDALRWAFTTTHMGHYQPLAWLVWSAVKAIFGLNPRAFHALSLAGHLLNAVLVYFVGLRLAALTVQLRRRNPSTPPEGRANAGGLRGPQVAALTAALLFAVHPLRVEAVAWASAFPYVLSLGALLVAFLAYLASATSRETARRGWWLGLSICSYTASLLARANAIGFPLVLLAVDVYLGRHDQAWSHNRARLQPGIWRLLLEKLPFVIVALVLASVESRSRELATLGEVGAGWRVTAAATAPLLYLWRTLAPLGLSPLDPLPIEARLEWTPLLLASVGLAAITIAAWGVRTHWPALPLAWAAYGLLLAPVLGLTPSGQQATANRYMYLPGVVVSLLAGAIVAHLVMSGRGRRTAAVMTVGFVTTLSAATWRQAGWWHDSIALWTRAADLDPRNDIATYNLATALGDAGREDEAIGRYEQTLRLVPDHDHARFNLNLILAKRAERDGNGLADTGRWDEALEEYGRVLALDPSRMRSRAARGNILMRRGRLAEAAEDLRIAFDGNVTDPAVPSALAYALMETGRPDQAAAVLKRAIAKQPTDVSLAHNLARLLATTQDPDVRNGEAALRLALEVRDRTGGRDPRVLDTLAAAYAAAGHLDLARVTAEQAVTLATRLGDLEMAREIAAHARGYAKRRP